MGEMVTMLVLWLVVIGVMWFLLMRPQKKEQKRIQLAFFTPGIRPLEAISRNWILEMPN